MLSIRFSRMRPKARDSGPARGPTLVELADRARDDRDVSGAAQLYSQALAQEPWRTDLRVQLGNMLKDSGRLAEAQTAYEDALRENPDAADTLVQLGHVHKLCGRRSVAFSCYRRALELDPLLAAARVELASQGETGAQLALFEQQMRAGGLDALTSLRVQLDDIAAQVQMIRETLPDAQATVAFPMEAYAEMRRLFDVPAPGGAAPDVTVTVMLLADRETLQDLHAQVGAVVDQSHALWRLCVLGSDADRREIVEQAASRDERIRWVGAKPGELAETELTVAQAARSDLVLLLAPGARLHRFALAWITHAAKRTGASAIVVDEEVGSMERFAHDLKPFLRQTVDAASLLGANIYGETVAVTAAALKAAPTAIGRESVSFARSRLLLSLIGHQPVAHIPLPLVQTHPRPQREEAEAIDAHRNAVVAHLGEDAAVTVTQAEWSPSIVKVVRTPRRPSASLAVVIPTKDNPGDLGEFVTSLFELACTPDHLNLIVVNNGRVGSVDFLKTIIARPERIQILDLDAPFNWSRFNNIAAAKTQSDTLVFANDDMRMISRDWDQTVRSFLEEDGVGVLGARLLYPDETLQHGGILFDWRDSVIHDGLYRDASEAGPGLRWHVTRAVSAVTGAFLATRRADFEAVGGFDEARLAVSYSDVDYALRQRARGRRALWTPMLSLFHHESKTRGLDHLDGAKAARDDAERRALERRWPGVLSEDPSLNPLWHQATLPHRLLMFPSSHRIWRHIERSALLNPWEVAPPIPTA
jgi:GT2 family glycosyltransferase/tetratricopeptide (TPR) repeat protein